MLIDGEDFNFKKRFNKLMCPHCGCYVLYPVIGETKCPKCDIKYLVKKNMKVEEIFDEQSND